MAGRFDCLAHAVQQDGEPPQRRAGARKHRHRRGAHALEQSQQPFDRLSRGEDAMARQIERLLFVYNADSGALGAIADSARKLLSINGCPLCALTHSLAGEKREWKSCREGIGVPIDYVHRDELTPEIKALVAELPCVVAQAGVETVILLTSDVIARCKGSIADFRGRL